MEIGTFGTSARTIPDDDVVDQHESPIAVGYGDRSRGSSPGSCAATMAYLDVHFVAARLHIQPQHGERGVTIDRANAAVRTDKRQPVLLRPIVERADERPMRGYASVPFELTHGEMNVSARMPVRCRAQEIDGTVDFEQPAVLEPPNARIAQRRFIDHHRVLVQQLELPRETHEDVAAPDHHLVLPAAPPRPSSSDVHAATVDEITVQWSKGCWDYTGHTAAGSRAAPESGAWPSIETFSAGDSSVRSLPYLLHMMSGVPPVKLLPLRDIQSGEVRMIGDGHADAELVSDPRERPVH